MSKTIAVDVDLTVCAIDELWLQWLVAVTRSPYYDDLLLNKQDMIDRLGWGNIKYDLSSYVVLSLESEGIDGLSFFRGTGVYDTAEQIEDSYKYLKYLSEGGYDIIFVSTCKGNHHKSKYYWLKRNFPFMKGFIATKEKQYVKADIFIDDRNDVLNKIDCPIKIKIDTPYTQTEELYEGTYVCNDWRDIYSKIMESESDV